MNNGISSAPTHTRILQQCRVPYVRKQVSQTAQPGSLMSWGLCWVVRKWGRAENTSCSIQSTSLSSVELSRYQKEWQHSGFFSLSQHTTLNIRCHLVKVICSAAGPLSTTHSMKESQHQCRLLSINPRHDLVDFSFSDKCFWLIREWNGNRNRKGRLAPTLWWERRWRMIGCLADLFLYYLTVIYKEWHRGGGQSGPVNKLLNHYFIILVSSSSC